MKTRMQKWGNSLALRVPKPFTAELHLVEDSVVEISLVDGKLVITPTTKPEITLEVLLKGVTEENLHRETDTGPAMGREVW